MSLHTGDVVLVRSHNKYIAEHFKGKLGIITEIKKVEIPREQIDAVVEAFPIYGSWLKTTAITHERRAVVQFSEEIAGSKTHDLPLHHLRKIKALEVV